MRELRKELASLRAEVLALTGVETTVGARATTRTTAMAARRRLLARLKPLRAAKETPAPLSSNDSPCPRCQSRPSQGITFGSRKMKRTNAQGEVVVTVRRQSLCSPCRVAHARDVRQAKRLAAYSDVQARIEKGGA